MTIDQLLVYFFGACALLGGLLMLVARHPMRVALALISCMLSLAGIYAMLGVHVVAVFQVLIYVGAVMVFMVYVIMLLDVRDASFLERYGRLLPSMAPDLKLAVEDAETSVGHMRMLAAEYGPRVAVWRYDTIIFSSDTPADFHRRNFERLARDPIARTAARTTCSVSASRRSFSESGITSQKVSVKSKGVCAIAQKFA